MFKTTTLPPILSPRPQIPLCRPYALDTDYYLDRETILSYSMKFPSIKQQCPFALDDNDDEREKTINHNNINHTNNPNNYYITSTGYLNRDYTPPFKNKTISGYEFWDDIGPRSIVSDIYWPERGYF